MDIVHTSDQEVPGSFPGSAMSFFSGGELFDGMFELGFYVFQSSLLIVHVLFLCCIWMKPLHSVFVLYKDHRNFKLLIPR